MEWPKSLTILQEEYSLKYCFTLKHVIYNGMSKNFVIWLHSME
jgi:hypothetical protein